MQLALRSPVEALRLVWLLFWAWSGNTLSEARMSSLRVMPKAVVPPVPGFTGGPTWAPCSSSTRV